MQSNIINQYPIREYLGSMNIHPAKDRQYYGMYHSPFREDKDASMKVDFGKNLWIDFGANEGGTLINLVMRMENCSNGEAMQMLEQHISGTSFSFQGNKNILPQERIKQEPAVRITGILQLSNPALLGYLKERCINIDIARVHCREIEYRVNGKDYFAVGFRNDSGGYELRNRYFKGCSSKDITSFAGRIDDCYLFEGFTDYLTFLTLKKWSHSPANVIVLNSLVNLPKVRTTLSQYNSVTLFLDNDEAGKKAVRELKSICKNVFDQSSFYRGYKDLNEYLCSRTREKGKQQRRGLRF